MSALWLLPVVALFAAAWFISRAVTRLRQEAALTAQELEAASLALRDLTDQSPEATALLGRMSRSQGRARWPAARHRRRRPVRSAP